MKKASSRVHSHSQARLPARLSPRKSPRQKRSQTTVDAILKGASQVLVRVGYERANTTLIARTAGVSVGSLYQYFPNKDAVFSALLKASFSAMIEGLRAIIREAPRERLEARVYRLVSATLAYKAQNPRLHRVLKTELGRLDGAKAMRQLSDQLLRLLEELFAAYRDELPLRDPARAAFFVFNTVEGVVCAALLDAPEVLSEPAFAQELSAALSAMLESLSRSSSMSRPA